MTQEIVKKLEGVNSKLGILIALQMVEEKPNTLRDKIKLLSDLGVETSEIASILGISPGHVAKERSLAKKRGKYEKGEE